MASADRVGTGVLTWLTTIQGIPLLPSADRVGTGALTWLTTIQGIPLLPSTGPARTAELLVTIARQQQQGWRAPSGVVTPQAPTPREQRLAVLAALPGVGPVRAASLLDHFGGLRAALAADAAALAAVPGVGSATAERLGALLR